MAPENTPRDWLTLHAHFLYEPRKAHEWLAHTPNISDILKQHVPVANVPMENFDSLLADWIPFDSEEYPTLLRHIADPPLGFFFRGASRKILKEIPWIGIVGARKAKPYSLERAHTLACELAGLGFGVISGLAFGVDGAAHRGALSVDGVTVGVMGTGLDRLYPPTNQKISEEMTKHGGLLTEFFPGTSPQAHHFPQRNRLISGIALGVVIVEAAEKSGSLITARYATEQGREVFVVPGETGVHSQGSNRLLKEGAKLVETGKEIADELSPQLQFFTAADKSPSSMEDKIFACLQKDPLPPEVVAKKCCLSVGETVSLLTQLECAGRAKRLPGNVFVRGAAA